MVLLWLECGLGDLIYSGPVTRRAGGDSSTALVILAPEAKPCREGLRRPQGQLGGGDGLGWHVMMTETSRCPEKGQAAEATLGKQKPQSVWERRSEAELP